jgi:gliding motility-associated-like protein
MKRQERSLTKHVTCPLLLTLRIQMTALLQRPFPALFAAFMLHFTTGTMAQMTVQGGLTAQQLAEIIAGPGIDIANPTITGAAVAYGSFGGVNNDIGLDSGVLLTSGDIQLALGPNSQGATGLNNGTPGNPMLQGLAGAQTFDAVVLEFDFIPLANTVQFNYVFGSDEYPEFVNSGFNDAFGFFISGPGINATYGTANYNMARVPGTTQPVTIDNVNDNTNNQHYLSNWGGGGMFGGGGPGTLDFEYDGATRVLTATAQVTACETYRLMLMIADAGDGVYDSGVFIEENSLVSGTLMVDVETATTDSVAYAGCTNATVNFTVPQPAVTDQVINFTLGGTAVNGVNYQQLPQSVTIPAGQTSVSLVVNPIPGSGIQGIQTVVIEAQTSVCETDDIIVYISDLEPLAVTAFGDTTFCPGGTAMLWATSTGGGGNTTFTWSNGMAGDTIFVTPNATAQYTVSVTDFCNSSNPTSNAVTVTTGLLPVTVEAFGDTSFCPGGTAMLWAEYGGGGGAPTIEWSTGETTDTIFVSPNTTSTYTVTASDACGAGTPTDDVTVTIDPLPVADAGPDRNFCAGDAVTITGAGGQTFDWYRLPAMELLTQTATVTLTPIGDTELMLVAFNGSCSDTDQVALTELPAEPFDMPADTTICQGGTAQLNVIGASPGSTYAWQPAPGLSSTTAQNPTISPASTAFYSVTVTTPSGCESTDSMQVIVNPLPVPGFTAPTACDNEATVFTNTSTIATGNILSYNWNFGDGNTAAQASPSFTFDSDGLHPVTLTATSDIGCVDSITQDVAVGPLPVASFSFANDCVDKMIAFADGSTVSSGQVVAWDWDFGNQETSDQQNPPMQQYPAAGIYNVQLTVTTDLGCEHDTVMQIELYPLPTAAYTVDAVCRGLANQFTDQSTANGSYPIASYSWVFQGGQTSDESDPLILFGQAGLHGATLTVTTTKGCQHTLVGDSATVFPNPVATFSAAIKNCLNDTTLFSHQSTVQDLFGCQIVGNTWDFGDGAVSTQSSPEHLFADVDFHDVLLTVVTDKGCTDSVTRQVEIFPLPEVAFASDLQEGCQPFRVQFLDQTTIPTPYSLASWSWDFGDGQGAVSTQFPVNTFNDQDILPLDVGTYTVSLEVTSGNGCVSSIEIADYITEHPKPSAHFDVSPQSVDLNDPRIWFTDLSSENVTGWDWTFGDGGTSIQQNPMHTYQDSGSYPIELFVRTAFGCLDTAQFAVDVRPAFTFYIPNTFTPNNDGENEFFFGQGTGIATYQIQIFNRWGEMLFESNDIDFPWDGTFRGQQVQVGVYLYMFTVVDWDGEPHYYKGHVNLMR